MVRRSIQMGLCTSGCVILLAVVILAAVPVVLGFLLIYSKAILEPKKVHKESPAEEDGEEDGAPENAPTTAAPRPDASHWAF